MLEWKGEKDSWPRFLPQKNKRANKTSSVLPWKIKHQKHTTQQQKREQKKKKKNQKEKQNKKQTKRHLDFNVPKKKKRPEKQYTKPPKKGDLVTLADKLIQPFNFRRMVVLMGFFMGFLREGMERVDFGLTGMGDFSGISVVF